MGGLGEGGGEIGGWGERDFSCDLELIRISASGLLCFAETSEKINEFEKV